MRIHSLKLPNKLDGKISLTKKANLTNKRRNVAAEGKGKERSNLV